VVQAIDQAERERELTKQALAANLDKLEARVRYEFDWKARLRRDGVRYALVGGIVIGTVVGVVVLRRTLRGDRPEAAPPPTTLAEMSAELSSIRKKLDSAKLEADSGPLWQKVALRAVSAAASAGGTYAARRFMARATDDAAASAARGE
jgi:hypothetical protein